MRCAVTAQLATACQKTAKTSAWLARLPHAVSCLERKWSLTIGLPFEGASCAWVAPVTLPNGTAAVLKLGMPHSEGEHELQGLRFWNGDPTVRLLEADDEFGGMLLEQCRPGTALRGLPEPEQDVVVAQLLRRLWRPPIPPHPFRPLSIMTAQWSDETLSRSNDWADSALVLEGLRLFRELPDTAPGSVLLATDLHAGNILRAEREAWLVIDPKPFIGDPAYDATQHLFNCYERLRSDPDKTIRRFANLLELDHDRIRLWTFARAVAEPRENWRQDRLSELGRELAP